MAVAERANADAAPRIDSLGTAARPPAQDARACSRRTAASRTFR